MKSIIAAIFSVILLQPLMTEAAVEWASWGPPAGNTSIGAFSGDKTVTLTANFTDITAGVAAGGEYTSDPVVTGRPDNTNPPFQRIMTGTPATLIANGDQIAYLDLTGITVDENTTFGLADQKSGNLYRLELLDATLAVLDLTGVQVNDYNITYASSGLVADYNSILTIVGVPSSGLVLYVSPVHDAGGFYSHTGLTTFSNLPAGTRYIALISRSVQEAEGIQIYLGADFSPGSFPNLIVTFINNPPAGKRRGSSFFVKNTVMNEGVARAGRFIVRYYLSLDTIKDDSDIALKGSRTLKKLKEGKSSNGKTRVTIKKSTPPGEYYLIVCADDTNKVSESNETDNCTASNTTITVK
jgi:hypothetical protein